jgi:hypothetical protein
LALLWYHTIVRPFFGVDGHNVHAGAEAATLLINESQKEFAESSLFLFFRGKVHRLKVHPYFLIFFIFGEGVNIIDLYKTIDSLKTILI